MRRAAVTIALLAAGLGGAVVARAELVQSGDVRLSLSGDFTPRALPRNRPAPVTLSLDGSILSVNGDRPPQVRRFSIAVNRYGSVFTRGLPSCHAGDLQQTSTRGALERCRPALIGHGRFVANVDLANQALSVEGEALAFNGRAGGRPVVLLHIYAGTPVQTTVVLVFKISHPRQGRYGTVFSTTIPKIASDLGYITNMRLTFGRRYRFAGRPRSFLSARCAAPSGFPGTIFAFARGRFFFAGGQRLTTTLTRNCLVR
jgi:hypothetical protein